jgi:hypothetical protein
MFQGERMSKSKKKYWLLLAASTLLVSVAACSKSDAKNATPQPSPEMIFTAAAQTVEARLTMTASAIPPTPTETQLPPTATATVAPMATVSTPATNAPISVATAVPCDTGLFVSETIPDGTSYAPGAKFTKTWTIKNVGTCTWSTSYKVVFISGEEMDAKESYALPKAVAPMESITISIDMTAPSKSGEYRGDWRLQNASGVNFGVQPGNSTFWVKIKVGSASSVTKTATKESEATSTTAPTATSTFTPEATATATPDAEATAASLTATAEAGG